VPCPPTLSCICLRETSSLLRASMTAGFVSFASALPSLADSVLMQFCRLDCSCVVSSIFMLAPVDP